MSAELRTTHNVIFDSSKVLEAGKTFPAAATTATTNELDLEAITDIHGNAIQDGLGYGVRPVIVMFLATAAGTGANAVTIRLQDSADGTTYADVASRQIAAAGTDISKGDFFTLALPPSHRRYFQGAVTCGTATTAAFAVYPITQ